MDYVSAERFPPFFGQKNGMFKVDDRLVKSSEMFWHDLPDADE